MYNWIKRKMQDEMVTQQAVESKKKQEDVMQGTDKKRTIDVSRRRYEEYDCVSGVRIF